MASAYVRTLPASTSWPPRSVGHALREVGRGGIELHQRAPRRRTAARSVGENSAIVQSHVEHFGEAGRLHRLGGGRVAVAEEHVRAPAGVRPAADEERRRVRAGVGEDRQARRRLPAVLDQVDAERSPTPPTAVPRRMHAALAAQRPHVDVLAADARVGRLDRLDDLRARRAVVEQHRGLSAASATRLRHGQAAHVRLVRARQPQRRVEEVEAPPSARWACPRRSARCSPACRRRRPTA